MTAAVKVRCLHCKRRADQRLASGLEIDPDPNLVFLTQQKDFPIRTSVSVLGRTGLENEAHLYWTYNFDSDLTIATAVNLLAARTLIQCKRRGPTALVYAQQRVCTFV